MKFLRLVLSITIFLPLTTFGQMYFANPSFEGPTGVGITGAPWSICCGTPDTGPGVFGVDMPASNGSTYIGLWDGGPLAGGCAGGVGEGASEKLPCALRSGKQYTFTLDVAWDLNGSATYTQGATLEVYGGMASCAKTSLLWSGAPTAAQVWQTKTVTFTPTSNWTYISFFAKSGSGAKYVLVDNLSPISRAATAFSSSSASCGGPGNDGSATVTPPADGTPWTFLWSDGQTTATATGLAPGSYTCKVSDPGEACPIPIFITVIIAGPPQVTVSASPTAICPPQTSQLQALVPPSSPPSCIYTLNLFDSFGDGWYNPGKVQVYVNAALIGTYTIPSGGSTASNTFSVVQGDNIQLKYTASSSYNSDNRYELRDASSAIVYNSGVGPANNSGWTGVANCGYTAPVYTYNWSPSPTLNNAGIYNPVASPTTTTTYSVSVVSSTNPGCASVKTVIISNNCVVPINLLSFSALKHGKNVDLKWATASELNNDHFTIEKSKDGVLFETVSIINSAGNSNNTQEYTAIDTNPFQGISYYRLKQTDYYGKSKYSEMVSINYNNIFTNIVVKPSLITENAVISFSSNQNCLIELSVFDILGQQVLKLETQNIREGSNTIPIEATKLVRGCYFLHLSGGTEIDEKIKIFKE